MAFGRKKRKNDKAEDEPAGASGDDTAADGPDRASEPTAGTGETGAPLTGVDQPGAVATPVDQPTAASTSLEEPGAVATPVDQPSATPTSLDETAASAPSVGDDPVAVETHSPGAGTGDDFVDAAASAGDPAAAGIDAEGPGASAPHGSPPETGSPEGHAPDGSATSGRTDAETFGSAAASPDPVAVPAGQGAETHAGLERDSGADEPDRSDQPGATAGLETLIESRPEMLVAGAFAAGLVAARILGALGGNR